MAQQPPQRPFQPGLVDRPKIALDPVHQHHRNFLGKAFPQFSVVIHRLFPPADPQVRSDASDGGTRRGAEVAVSFGDEDDVGAWHSSTVTRRPVLRRRASRPADQEDGTGSGVD